MPSKVLPLRSAVRDYVEKGSIIGFAGSSGRISIAFAYELIRQRIGGLLFVSAGTGAPCLDLLVGAELVKRAEISFTMTNNANIRRAIEGRNAKSSYRFEIEDYSNLAMTYRFFAGANKLPFIPIRSLAGSDIEKIRTFKGNEKMVLVKSPFADHMKVEVLPPCSPDVSVMHAQYADENGNVLALGPSGSDAWLLKAGKKRIITVEKLVSKEFVQKNRLHTFVPGFIVDAVCEVPYGAHPYGLVGCYRSDVPFLSNYNSSSKTKRGFDEWTKEWIFDIKTREEYLEKLGRKRIEELTNARYLKDTLFQ